MLTTMRVTVVGTDDSGLRTKDSVVFVVTPMIFPSPDPGNLVVSMDWGSWQPI